MYGGTDPAAEFGDMKAFDFSDQTIRRGFIKKVYSILMLQLTLTMSVIAIFQFHEPTREYVNHNIWPFIVTFIGFFVSIIALSCCGEVRRKAPMNFIFLGIFTAAESFFLGITASTYDTDAVLMAVGMTAAVCLALTLFAMQTKYDFTMMGGVLLVALVIFILFGFLAIFIRTQILYIFYAAIGALLFSIFLIYDTQLMLGGKHKCAISPEEYIFAALNLYLDIINIFTYILMLVGGSRK